MARSKGYRRNLRVRETPAEGYAPASEALSGVLLDSDVIIEILRDNRAIAADLEELVAGGARTYCTAIAWAEVFAGLRKGEEPLAVEFFETRGEVILDGITGRRAGAYLARYGRSHGVQIADALVAAAASTAGLRLWTLNRRHFPMEDLRLFDPAQPRS
jgi:predicted nucleic acid-binding protein